MVNRAINAGVDAQTGFALQRNIALHFILEKYENVFKDANYFVCMEHHDDFLFCFLNDEDEVKFIEAYQSKKSSSKFWTINDSFHEIIEKLLKTGKQLISDNSVAKSIDYKHFLIFVSNQVIKLEAKDENKKTVKKTIKEDLTSVSYNDLDSNIKDKIKGGIDNTEDDLHNELPNIKLYWVDMNTTVQKQIDQLAGQISRIFGDSISYPYAAIKVLVSLFNEIETIYNNGQIAQLLDPQKRLFGADIEAAIKMLRNNSKNYAYWQSRVLEICKVLEIKRIDRGSFELAFKSSFDRFKSKTETEHRSIFNFVKSNFESCTSITDEDCAKELLLLFEDSAVTTQLTELQYKAAIFAATLEVFNTYTNNNEINNKI